MEVGGGLGGSYLRHLFSRRGLETQTTDQSQEIYKEPTAAAPTTTCFCSSWLCTEMQCWISASEMKPLLCFLSLFVFVLSDRTEYRKQKAAVLFINV